MAYTRPSSDAAHADFSAEGVYARPIATTADASFDPAFVRLYAISGMVIDADTQAAARIVRLYARSNGVLLSETVSDGVTGEFTAWSPTDSEVQCVVIATEMDATNHQIARATPAA